MHARWPIAIALLAAAGGAGGCGQSADTDAARAVTGRFLAAVRSGDGTLACAQLPLAPGRSSRPPSSASAASPSPI
jgi:hypothetical protein